MSIIYWLVFFFWALSAFFFRKGSFVHLLIAFVLFTVSAFLKTFSLGEIAEPIMRISFLGWVIGLTVATREYQKS